MHNVFKIGYEKGKMNNNCIKLRITKVLSAHFLAGSSHITNFCGQMDDPHLLHDTTKSV